MIIITIFILCLNNNIFFIHSYFQRVFKTNLIKKEKLMKLQRTLSNKLKNVFSRIVEGRGKRV
jgi:hypothetical protein